MGYWAGSIKPGLDQGHMAHMGPPTMCLDIRPWIGHALGNTVLAAI